MAIFNRKNENKDLPKPNSEEIVEASSDHQAVKEEVKEVLANSPSPLPEELVPLEDESDEIESGPSDQTMALPEAEIDNLIEASEAVLEETATDVAVEEEVNGEEIKDEAIEVIKSTDMVLNEMIKDIDHSNGDDHRIARLNSLNQAIETRLSEITIEKDRLKTLRSLNERKHTELLEEIDSVKNIRQELDSERKSVVKFENNLSRIKKENNALSERLTAEIVSAEEARLEADRLLEAAARKHERVERDRSFVEKESLELQERERAASALEKEQADLAKELAEKEVEVKAAEAMREENASFAKSDREASARLYSQAKEIKDSLTNLQNDLSGQLEEAEKDRAHVLKLKTDAERLSIEAEEKLAKADTKLQSAEVRETAAAEKEELLTSEIEAREKEIETREKDLERREELIKEEVREKDAEVKNSIKELAAANRSLKEANDKIDNLSSELETNKLAVNQLRLEEVKNPDLQAKAADALRSLSSSVAGIDRDTTDPTDLSRIQYTMEVLLEMSQGTDPVGYLENKTQEIIDDSKN